jgi:general secretion pathway protein I
MSRGRTRSRSPRRHDAPAPGPQTGFTLLEVLVALAVVAIALSALVESTTGAARNLGYLRDKTLAHWVARNEANTLQLQRVWPALGRFDGVAEMGDREWYWQAEISGTPIESIRRIEISVSGTPGAGAQPIVVLADYLRRPPSDARAVGLAE